MNIQTAIALAQTGSKVKLPEWTGYWFIPKDRQASVPMVTEDTYNDVRVFTKTGDILDTPWIEKYKDRTDFEVADGRLGFDFAILAIKSGKKVAREGWNGKGMWMQLQVPDAHSKMGHPYPYMRGVDGLLFPWNPNALDLMAEDWMVVVE